VSSLYLLLAVELTSLARRGLPRRLWWRVHLASFGLFAASTVHALTAGTDTAAGLGMVAVVVPAVAVIAMIAGRITRTGEQVTPVRTHAGVSQAAVLPRVQRGS